MKWVFKEIKQRILYNQVIDLEKKAPLNLATNYYRIKNNKANNEELFGQVSLKFQLFLFFLKFLFYLWLKFYFRTFVTKM